MTAGRDRRPAALGLADQGVEPAEGVEGGGDERGGALGGGDVDAVGDGLAASGPDPLDDGEGRAVGSGRAVETAAEVADDDPAAPGGERERAPARGRGPRR